MGLSAAGLSHLQRLLGEVVSILRYVLGIGIAQPFRERRRCVDVFADAHELEHIVDHARAFLEPLGLGARGGAFRAPAGLVAQLLAAQINGRADQAEESHSAPQSDRVFEQGP